MPGSFDSVKGGEGRKLSDFGVLPSPYPSQSKTCLHDLGGLTMHGQPLREGGEKDGAIIGVKQVRVTCLQCKGLPYLTGKHKGRTQTNSRSLPLTKELPAAKALYAVHGNSLFGEEAEETGDDDENDPHDDEADKYK